jgi:type I restriction enzyme S subunit
MVDILISIKPEFAEKILEGKKRYEFRRRVPRKRVSQVFIYASSPRSSIVGKFTMAGVVKGSPSYVWKKCGEEGGIDSRIFISYCRNSRVIYGLEIAEVERFDPPIDPYHAKPHFHPPQSFVYIGQDLSTRFDEIGKSDAQ